MHYPESNSDSNATAGDRNTVHSPCLPNMHPNNDSEPIAPIAASNRNQEHRKWHEVLRPPYVMLVISFVQVMMYLLSDTRMMQALHYDPQRQLELWRLVTYMLLHQDASHLLQNVLPQCFFGLILESFESKRWKVLIVYVGGGVGGVLGAAALCTGLTVGASAGVYALLLAQVLYILLNYDTIDTKYRRYLVICAKVVCLIFCANIIWDIFIACPSPVAVHIFGAIFGLLIGLILFPSNDNGNKYTKILSTIASVLLTFVLSILIMVNGINTCTYSM